jgi:hypothetical protein
MFARAIILLLERWWSLWLFWLFVQWMHEQQRMMADDNPRKSGKKELNPSSAQ